MLKYEGDLEVREFVGAASRGDDMPDADPSVFDYNSPSNFIVIWVRSTTWPVVAYDRQRFSRQRQNRQNPENEAVIARLGLQVLNRYVVAMAVTRLSSSIAQTVHHIRSRCP